MSLAGRTAIVTGAGRGIGRATALQLARMGAAVVVNDLGTTVEGTGHDARVAAAVVAEIEAAGGRAIASAASVTDFAGVERMVAEAVDRFGGVDVLINNAGMSSTAPIWEMDPDVFDRVSASHAKGTFNTIRCAAPHMRARGWGRIVNLVSRAGLVGIPGTAAYAAGKGAIFALTQRRRARPGVLRNHRERREPRLDGHAHGPRRRRAGAGTGRRGRRLAGRAAGGGAPGAGGRRIADRGAVHGGGGQSHRPGVLRRAWRDRALPPARRRPDSERPGRFARSRRS